MTRVALNNSLWVLGLVLQCSLLALLFRRRIARTLPVFTFLIVFYLLRSALLFVLARHIDYSAYASTYDALSIADLLLQLLVATEIAIRLVRIAGTSGLAASRRTDLLFLLPCLALGATTLLCHLLPASPRVPPDRMQLFNWFAMVFLCLWAIALPKPTPPATSLLRRVLLGFASYGALGICVTAVRTLTAANREAFHFAPSSYSLPAYILPVAWLAVVLYWIAILRPHTNTAPQPLTPPAAIA
jgi:hypothetical protein